MSWLYLMGSPMWRTLGLDILAVSLEYEKVGLEGDLGDIGELKWLIQGYFYTGGMYILVTFPKRKLNIRQLPSGQNPMQKSEN